MKHANNFIAGQTILVTGGTGYIGSHCAVQLLDAGANVVLLDNLSNSKRQVVRRIETITKRRPEYVCGDVRDEKLLRAIFRNHKIDAVIHFAGLKSVSESENDPVLYYDNNLHGSLTLFREMDRAGVRRLVFSSSATVYGHQSNPQYHEAMATGPFNPYGQTKLMVEQVLRDIRNANPNWQIALLRYFNPVGAHISGLIGEDPCGVPNNLMPFIAQVAVGKRDFLSVYGGDYETPDGTAKRDYIHVDDLAEGHLAALRTIACNNELITVNLGTGKPVSVLEMIRSFELESDKQITYRIVGRRPGDLPEYYADPSLAKKILGWEARCDLHRMCRDVWRWQSANPLGYSTPDPAMPILLAA